MIKLLFLVVSLFIQDPMTSEIYVVHELSQVKGQTCEQTTKDLLKDLDETHEARHIVQVVYDCKITEVDPSDNQNGTT